MSTRNIDIRPEVAIFSAFARLNYKPWYALAEFVDNSIQSYLLNRERLQEGLKGKVVLRIDVHLSEDSIEIKDNAAGITWKDFPRAFLPASPPPDTSGLSEYGLGLKAAACWFAANWSVRTSALGEPFEREIEFDVPNISEHKVNHLPVLERPAELGAHYTVVTLRNLNVVPRTKTVTKIRSHLASIYRLYLSSGLLELQIDSEPVTYAPPSILKAAHFETPNATPIVWRKDFELSLDDGHRIWGWAGLLNRASVSNAGFSLFRRDRLIEGSYGEAYRPIKLFRRSNSYTYQRLVGELHVEGFDVSHTKDGIQWAEWEDDVLDWLKSKLEETPVPLLSQAEGYRARIPKDSTLLPRVASDTEKLLVQRVPPLVDAQLMRGPVEPAPKTSLDSVEVKDQRDLTLKMNHAGQTWSVRIELVTDQPDLDWVDIATHEKTQHEHSLQIRINLSHPFMQRFSTPSGSELAPLVRLAAGLAVAETTARTSGVKQAGTIRRNLNELLREALSGSPQVVLEDESDDDQ